MRVVTFLFVVAGFLEALANALPNVPPELGRHDDDSSQFISFPCGNLFIPTNAWKLNRLRVV